MRRILFAITTICLVGVASAQYRSSGGGDKVYFGGGFGLSIGTDVTSISASPLVGYKITDIWSAGMSVTYQYVNYKSIDLSVSNYGLAPFTRVAIGDKYFTHAEYEFLNFEYPTGFLTPDGDPETKRDGYNSLWLGGGYTERGFFVLALYNVLYDENELSPYASPFSIRAGFSFGF
jgi:hypothetical protein